ncbi:hypothetical protein LDVICp074 [lymphocystis disease virus-China]|uniref:Uncharacterized protein n=1 Tax=lymphocystis disease virus-China TaxID=256729 RepID=Q678D7_9VIRU|nr:hypothetical protein LDVICp074 [lymphocystis disease virus-China]AAU10920.1 hypothetical protein [lymphocystis disease virus-China]
MFSYKRLFSSKFSSCFPLMTTIKIILHQIIISKPFFHGSTQIFTFKTIRTPK